jgi:hypothetical protein
MLVLLYNLAIMADWEIQSEFSNLVLERFNRTEVQIGIDNDAIRQSLDLLDPHVGGKLHVLGVHESEMLGKHLGLTIPAHRLAPDDEWTTALIAVAGERYPKRVYRGGSRHFPLNLISNPEGWQELKAQKMTGLFSVDHLNNVMMHELQHVVDISKPDGLALRQQSVHREAQIKKLIMGSIALGTVAWMIHDANISSNSFHAVTGIGALAVTNAATKDYHARYSGYERRARAVQKDYKRFPAVFVETSPK